MELTIRLFNSDAAIRKIRIATPDVEDEDRIAPFTTSPIDSGRGSKKSRPRVRDVAKNAKAKAKAST